MVFPDKHPMFLIFKDILFGVPWRETAIKKSYVHNRQRVVSFAVTVVLQKYDPL